MNANPTDFSRLLDILCERGVSIRFDGDRLHWEAYDDDVDSELLTLLRRFRNPLRQAYGPDRLPIEQPRVTRRGVTQ